MSEHSGQERRVSVWTPAARPPMREPGVRRQFARILALGVFLSGVAAAAEGPVPAPAVPPSGLNVAPAPPAPVFLVCPADAEQVQAAQKAAAAALGAPVRFTNAMGMDFMLIPPGEFTMGSSPTEEGRRDNEDPPHRVRIPKAFYLSVTSVTQYQYRKVMGYNPAMFRTPERPVERVSWHQAVQFCDTLSAKEHRRYRLATEAEWEYACRAGSATRFWWGDALEDAPYHAHVPRLVPSGDSSQKGVLVLPPATSPVGLHEPNAFGLRGMIGNVWDWCQSLKRPYPYRIDDGREGLATPGERVLRGGSWRSYPEYCRSAARYGLDAASKDTHVGFRVVLVISPRR